MDAATKRHGTKRLAILYNSGAIAGWTTRKDQDKTKSSFEHNYSSVFYRIGLFIIDNIVSNLVFPKDGETQGCLPVEREPLFLARRRLIPYVKTALQQRTRTTKALVAAVVDCLFMFWKAYCTQVMSYSTSSSSFSSNTPHHQQAFCPMLKQHKQTRS